MIISPPVTNKHDMGSKKSEELEEKNILSDKEYTEGSATQFDVTAQMNETEQGPSSCYKYTIKIHSRLQNSCN